MKRIKENKGITLVALIITIIVLLILAVVAISAVQGDGIISHAKNARDDYQTAQDEENIILGNYITKLNNANNEQDDAEKKITVAGVTFSGYYEQYDQEDCPIEESFVSEVETLTWEDLKNGVDKEKYKYGTITDTAIGEYAFSGCDYLTNITIPNSITSIGDGAFSCCSRLTSISIPSNITNIGNCVFELCSNLISINVDKNNRSYLDIDGVLLNKEKTTLISYPIRKSDTDYAIPVGVTSIEDEAFYECEKLKNVTIPDSVTNIGESAFDSTGLESIIYKESTYTNESAFSSAFTGTIGYAAFSRTSL